MGPIGRVISLSFTIFFFSLFSLRNPSYLLSGGDGVCSGTYIFRGMAYFGKYYNFLACLFFWWVVVVLAVVVCSAFNKMLFGYYS